MQTRDVVERTREQTQADGPGDRTEWTGAAGAGGTTGVAGAGGVGAGATPDASAGCACRLADGHGSGGRDGRRDLLTLFALCGLAAIRRRRS